MASNYGAYKALIANKQSYLYSTGWMATIEHGYPCGPDGSEVPWMNYAILTFLDQRLGKEHRMFEYGSGHSTRWYAHRVAQVTSVEHDSNWFRRMNERLPQNARLLLRAHDVDGEYCRSIHESGDPYHVVVIDGVDRVHCMCQAVEALTENGVVLLDDSDRAEYSTAIAQMREDGFLSLDFEALKPAGASVERTTLFYRRNSCFKI